MYAYTLTIETYRSSTDEYRTWEPIPGEYGSDSEAEAAAKRLWGPDVTRVYIRRDDGRSWNIG